MIERTHESSYVMSPTSLLQKLLVDHEQRNPNVVETKQNTTLDTLSTLLRVTGGKMVRRVMTQKKDTRPKRTGQNKKTAHHGHAFDNDAGPDPWRTHWSPLMYDDDESLHLRGRSSRPGIRASQSLGQSPPTWYWSGADVFMERKMEIGTERAIEIDKEGNLWTPMKVTQS